MNQSYTDTELVVFAKILHIIFDVKSNEVYEFFCEPGLFVLLTQ